MTLFPKLNPTYYTEGNKNIIQMMDDTYSKYITINQSFWSEADIDMRFKVGDQTLWNDIYGNLPAFRRKQFNFNRIRRTVNMISGHQRQHRKSTSVVPVEGSDQQTADQSSKLIYHVNNSGNVLPIISEAFEGALTTGMNLMSVWMDYRNDPVNGDIRVDNVAYNAYLIDPYFKKMDLSDCNSLWTRKYLSRSQTMALLPGREEEIENMQGWGNRDGKFQFLPEAYNYGMQDLLVYDEFWYMDSRTQKNLVDGETGECIEWKGNDEDLEEFLKFYPQIIQTNSMVPSVRLAIVVQGKVMYDGPNPMGTDKYPFVPVWGYYDPEIPYFPWRVQGVVRAMRDAQYLYNRRRIIELDILESQINSGYIYKENSLVNPKDVFLQGQGRGLALKAGAQMDDVRKIEAPQVPPSMIQLSELLGKEIGEVSGVNEELLGSAEDDKAGVLSMLRQGAGLTTLQILFDQLDQSQKLLGGLTLDIIQKNWTPGKVRRIINEEPSSQFYNRAFGKYDIVIEDGLNTSTQKQYQFAQLMKLKELGLPIPATVLVEASTLQNKQELVNALQQQEEQQSQAQQQQQEVQIEVLKAQIEDLKSRAMANEGLGIERASRVQENRALAVERIAEAQKDRDLGTFDRIKAIKELTDIDLGQLEKALGIIEQIQRSQAEETQERTQEKLGESKAFAE
ncbi:MAG: hypothetical protein ACLFUW_00310 [Bacteroidales bacterium]